MRRPPPAPVAASSENGSVSEGPPRSPFDALVDVYDARPSYPAECFEGIDRCRALDGAHLVEVGAVPASRPASWSGGALLSAARPSECRSDGLRCLVESRLHLLLDRDVVDTVAGTLLLPQVQPLAVLMDDQQVLPLVVVELRAVEAGVRRLGH